MHNKFRIRKNIDGKIQDGLRETGVLRQSTPIVGMSRSLPLNGNHADDRGYQCIIDGSKEIKIEFRMKVAGADSDLDLLLVDIESGEGDIIYLGNTTYTSRGMWTYGTGTFSMGVSQNSNPAAAGTWYEYRLTVNGTSVTGQRGTTLASINYTINGTLASSASGRLFALWLGSGSSPYLGGYFDWIRVINGGDTIFFDDFSGASLNTSVWESCVNMTFPGDGTVGVGISASGNVKMTAVKDTSVTFADRDGSYNKQLAIFNGSTSVITDVNDNGNYRSMSDTQKWTISFLYKPTGNSGANALIMQAYSGGAGWWASKTSSEKLNFATANSGGTTYKTTTSVEGLVQNAIHHIILEWDGTTLTQYVNLQSVSETKSGSTTKTDTLQIGGTGVFGYHSMECGRIRCFNRILSGKEKIDLFNDVFKLLH